MKVQLTKSEMAIASQASSLRWQLARASSVANRKVDKSRSDADIDHLGIMAEIAFSKLFGIDFNASALGIDSGGDLYIDDYCIQVKSTFHENGNLLLTNHDRMEWDFAVLVTTTDEQSILDIVGVISKTRALSVEEKKDLGHGVGRFISRQYLADISVLWSFLASKRCGPKL